MGKQRTITIRLALIIGIISTLSCTQSSIRDKSTVTKTSKELEKTRHVTNDSVINKNQIADKWHKLMLNGEINLFESIDSTQAYDFFASIGYRQTQLDWEFNSYTYTNEISTVLIMNGFVCELEIIDTTLNIDKVKLGWDIGDAQLIFRDIEFSNEFGYTQTFIDPKECVISFELDESKVSKIFLDGRCY